MGEMWYYVQDKRRVGPVSREQLRQLAGAGQVRRTDMVLKSGTQQWHPAADVPGLLAAFSADPRPLAPLDPLTTTPLPLLRPGPAVAAPSAPDAARPVVLPSANAPASTQPKSASSEADQWFYVQEKKRLGPVGGDQLKQLALAGQLLVSDMVLRAGQKQWLHAGDVPDLFPATIAEDEDEDEEEDEGEDGDDEDEEAVDIQGHLERARQFQSEGDHARAAAAYEELIALLVEAPPLRPDAVPATGSSAPQQAGLVGRMTQRIGRLFGGAEPKVPG